MKLRIQGNSLRLRISPEEVEELRNNPHIVQKVRFDVNSDGALYYELMFAESVSVIEATFKANRISIVIPLNEGMQWLNSESESISTEQQVDGAGLSILVEKDRFQH